MAESKNIFLKGRMNKDLDNRLLGKGEYRDALNISVGKSENNSVGSLQNILGNELLRKPSSAGTVPFESNTNLVCIGNVVDNQNNRVFLFLTDYVDQNPSLITAPNANNQMKVAVYSPSNISTPYLTLVEGVFLNFSTTNLITGVNLVENLLFWTDNRNQPRKINVDTAIANSVESGNPYYTNSEQITVAKYAPFLAPELYTISGLINISFNSSLAGEGGYTILDILTSDITAANIEIGDQLISEPLNISQADNVIITNIIPSGLNSIVYITGIWPGLTGQAKFYKRTLDTVDTYSNINGNDNFLRDKFVRFSYRFKFDDNEYSLMAPFTQPTFIPNQKGYFINGDEDAAYRSTVLEWMENSVNQVNLLITLPDTGNNIRTSYKITSIDILYKESDSLAVKVVETIPITEVQQVLPTTNLYAYKYQSQKPKKTLQEAETLRVYDRVPIRALSQESVGNRIIYGNFVNQNTPPANLNYNVTVVEKGQPYTPFVSWVEYPNHTLKQNRTYQVGFVLADKFGRQSSVILSSVDPEFEHGNLAFGASSIFFPYKNGFLDSNVRAWYGDELVVRLNEQIASSRNTSLGTPGLYATVSGNVQDSSDGFQITAGVVNNVGPYTYTYTLAAAPAQINRPRIGNYLKGKYKDYVKVLTASTTSLTADGPISEIYNYDPLSTNIKYSYAINELGWYSYKIVVKQQEQDYYNVYVPGILAGYPMFQTEVTLSGSSTPFGSKFPANENNTTAHFISINDNINKVPRDLSEVGPNQKQYRSSVQLWGRVENYLMYTGTESTTYTTNIQYYPGNQPDVVNTITPATDLNFLISSDNNVDGTASNNFYQLNSNPLTNRVSTSKQIGVIASQSATAPSVTWEQMTPMLAVYETNPVISALDIFWETSTAGYISDLNIDVLTAGGESIGSYSSLGFKYYEDQDFQGANNNIASTTNTGVVNSPWITDSFYFMDSFGAPVLDITNIVFSVINRDGQTVTSSFALVQDPASLYWRIKITQSSIYFGINADTYGSFVFTFNITHTVLGNTYNPILTTNLQTLRISNRVPIISSPDIGANYFLTSNPLIGPIANMIGENGVFSAGGSPGINDSIRLIDLYWKKLSVTGGDNPAIDPTGFFSVDPAAGDISLTTTEIKSGTYTVNLRLQDSTQSNGFATTGSLYADTSVNLTVPDVSAGCGEWISEVTVEYVSSVPTWWAGNVRGKINIWKMLRPGEQIVGSTVKANLWKSPGTIGVPAFPFEDPQPAGLTTNVDFLSRPPGYTIGDGYFNCFMYTARPIGGTLLGVAAEEVQFQGSITTNLGRTFIVNFISDGVLLDPTLGEQYVQANYCISNEQPGHPDQYIPGLYCRNWKIENNSAFPVPWSGMHGDRMSIIGDVLQPNAQIGTPEFFGTQPLVRGQSLQSAGLIDFGEIVTGGLISYGEIGTCPV
jgi:hypothetical protein